MTIVSLSSALNGQNSQVSAADDVNGGRQEEDALLMSDCAGLRAGLTVCGVAERQTDRRRDRWCVRTELRSDPELLCCLLLHHRRWK